MRCCFSNRLTVFTQKDFTLNDGTQYKGVKVSRAEPDGLVSTTYGVIKLFATCRRCSGKYHYDPKRRRKLSRFQRAARDAAADEVSAAAERERQARATNQKAAQKPVVSSSSRVEAGRDIHSLSLDAHDIGTADGYQS